MVLRAFGVVVGHSPSTILSLPAFVSRSPPDNSCMYPSWIGSVGLCVRLGLPGASNPWRSPAMRQILRGVNGGAGAILRLCAGFPSERLTSSNMATWVLSTQESNTAGYMACMRHQELCFSAFVLGAAIASDNCRHSRNMRPEQPIFQSGTLPESN